MPPRGHLHPMLACPLPVLAPLRPAQLPGTTRPRTQLVMAKVPCPCCPRGRPVLSWSGLSCCGHLEGSEKVGGRPVCLSLNLCFKLKENRPINIFERKVGAAAVGCAWPHIRRRLAGRILGNTRRGTRTDPNPVTLGVYPQR